MKTYLEMCARPALFPVRFRYGGELIKGFGPELFQQTGRADSMEHGIRRCCLNFLFDGQIVVRAETEYDPEFSAYGWTVWFENAGTEDTKVISDLVCADLVFPGGHPLLRGILGDHINQYRPYTYDLCRQDAAFRAVTGRATHVNFPYFMLETDEGTSMIAIGWAGTWEAEFRAVDAGTRLNASGVVGLKTYLKPGERIRTPQMYIVACPSPERDAQAASNHWRRWFLSRVMPRKSACSAEPVQPMITNCLASDTGRPNSDGSISEYSGSWKPSMEKYYEEGLEMDLRWVDAGWYCDAENQTVPADWWGTVGTWTLDRTKWPERSFRDSVDYAMARGTRTLLWFEPERVTQTEALEKNYGYNPKWILTDGGSVKLNHLGDPDCVRWLADKILATMETHGIHMYREDFNCDPAPIWRLADDAQPGQRTGITENLYIQGHYRLWDMILAYCRKHDKLPFIDSCASGGGRNDLESMRRAVPLLRSDSDRTSTGLRLAMTTSFMEWIPCCGASAKETTDQLAAGAPDLYVLRASYLPVLNYGFAYVHDKTLNYDLLRKGQQEWKQIRPYFYGDFYVLTPWHPEQATDRWTVFMFLHPERGAEKAENGEDAVKCPDPAERRGGVIMAFRQEQCPEPSVTVRLRGLCDDTEYEISDIDANAEYRGNSVACAKGSRLQAGLRITLPEARSAAILFLKPLS